MTPERVVGIALGYGLMVAVGFTEAREAVGLAIVSLIFFWFGIRDGRKEGQRRGRVDGLREARDLARGLMR